MKPFYIKKSTIKILAVITIIILLDLCFIFIKSNSLEYSQEDIFLINKYKEKKLLAITFDDGPSKYTPEILNVLEKENIKATFFILGENAEKNKEILLQEKDNNHMIGIHSYKHVFFTKISKEEVKKQIESTKKIIVENTGITPIYIRVPYGILNNTVKKILKENDLENVLWTVDSLDWNYKNTQKTFEHVINTTNGNDIILFHDTFKTTAETIDKTIKYYKEKGYEFVTVYDFYRIKNMANINN